MLDDIIFLSHKLNKKWVKGFKQLGNNPIALTKSDFISNVIPNIENYYITDKADGIRSFLILDENPRFVTSVSTIKLDKQYAFDSQYVFDCELIVDKDNKESVYIFDIIENKGENVTNKTFKERHQLIMAFKEIISKIPLDFIKIKNYYPLHVKNYQNNLLNLYKEKFDYNTDGIIFTNITQNYNNTINYKWKPSELLTIDFLAVKIEENKYILMTGITLEMYKRFAFTPLSYYDYKKIIEKYLKINFSEKYFPIFFYNSLKPNIFIFESKKDLDNHIVELSYDIKKQNWVFHKIRTDRDVELNSGAYFGNNYKVAEMTLQSALNPLNLKDLIAPYSTLTKDFYFEKNYNKDNFQINKFHNYIKRLLIMRYKNAKNVMDLGSGRGGDLNKYASANVKNLLMLEYDINAIDEAFSRKYDIIAKKYVEDINNPTINNFDANGCNLVMLKTDLNDNYKSNIKMIESNFEFNNLSKVTREIININFTQKESFDVIFSNFAFHYMLYSQKSAENIIEFINYYLVPGGQFIINIMDGKKIFDLLKKNKGKWKNDKYSIEIKGKLKSSFSNFDNKILILLPFKEDMVEENLIDLYTLDKLFKKRNIKRIEEKNYSDMLQEYKNYKPDIYSKFDKDDLEYENLLKYVIYSKNI